MIDECDPQGFFSPLFTRGEKLKQTVILVNIKRKIHIRICIFFQHSLFDQ